MRNDSNRKSDKVIGKLLLEIKAEGRINKFQRGRSLSCSRSCLENLECHGGFL